MIYTHVARQGVAATTSPLDLLDDVTAEVAAEVTGRLRDPARYDPATAPEEDLVAV